MKRKYWVTLLILLMILSFPFLSVDYAYVPPKEKVLNARSFQQADTGEYQRMATKLEYQDEELINLGRNLFYSETFGNEAFFSDIMGLYDGPLTIINIGKAIARLKGGGTNNLKVEAAEDFQAGTIDIKKGDLIETGLDVAKGSLSPLGVKVVYEEGRLKAGLSCAVCHASVDTKGKIMEGIPNSNLNTGLLLAMGTNSASYFSHAEIGNLKNYISKLDDRDLHNTLEFLPDHTRLEKAVDKSFVTWPKGSNSTTINREDNPVQSPHVFTKEAHPYGWSGQGRIGPLNGLVAAINNAHGQNTDPFTQAESSKNLFGIDKNVYLATLLQNAANQKLRYNPESDESATEFFDRVDPTPGNPGINEVIKAPTYPKASYLSTTGVFPSSPGYHAWEQNIALSTFMNSLSPPDPEQLTDPQTYTLGEETFHKAGCISCHAGENYTNNKVIPVEEIGTDPSRARALKITEKGFKPPIMYEIETPVPLPENPKTIELGMTSFEKEQLELGWAQKETMGGYKVPSLHALRWTAPYLHDGGVAVGPSLETDLGISGTFISGIEPDPYNSLKALVDQELRQRVVSANEDNRVSTHVKGIGHEYWVDDSTGFTEEQQRALIQFLLHLK